MDLLTKSSSEKLSKFLCPDYDGITEKHPHFKTFVEYIFRKPTLSTAPRCPEVGRTDFEGGTVPGDDLSKVPPYQRGQDDPGVHVGPL